MVEKDGRLMAQVLRPEACATCRACNFGQKQELLLELPKGRYRLGQEVELTLPDGNVGKASLLAYGLPLAALGLGLYLGGLVGAQAGNLELFQAGGALLFLALGLLAIRRLEPRLKRSGRFDVQVDGCPHAQAGEHRKP